MHSILQSVNVMATANVRILKILEFVISHVRIILLGISVKNVLKDISEIRSMEAHVKVGIEEYVQLWDNCMKKNAIFLHIWNLIFTFHLECDCNKQAKTCHNRTGRCYCTTKGIIGDKCDKCDRGNQYYGDPVKDSCFCKFIV